jgi:hypothetical protein
MKTLLQLLVLATAIPASGNTASTEISPPGGQFNLARTWSTGGNMLGSESSFSFAGELRREPSAASYTVDAQTDSFFKILGLKARVIDGNASASFALAVTEQDSAEGDESLSAMELTSNGAADLNLRVMGVTVASFHREFVRSDSSVLASFTTSPLIKEVRFAEHRFMVGPVPVRVSAGASMELRGEGLVQSIDNGGTTGIEARMGPVFDAALVASGAVDAGVAVAGVEAKASLAKAAVQGVALLKSEMSSGIVDYGLDVSWMGTNGKLALFARALLPGIEWRKVKIGWFRVKIPVPVLRWHHWNTALAHFESTWNSYNIGRGTAKLW